MEKNYSYLAIQLQKFCHSHRRRQLEIAFDLLLEHATEAEQLEEEQEQLEQRAASHAMEPAPVSARVEPRAAPLVVESSRSRRARAIEENFHLGFQTLSSMLALQLRYALRRWENFARRKQFEERQSKVVHALRNVQAELDGKRHQPSLGSPGRESHSVVFHSPAEMSPGSPAESTPHFRAQRAGEVLRSELLAAGHGGFGPSPRTSHGFPSDDDFVKSLSEDQARIDEVIKLAAILWDNASLANMQPAALPLVLLRASLLARMAERCQRHVMKEALHLLWKRCTLKRSMEELISQGLLKPGHGTDASRHSLELVTQGPAAHHAAEAPELHSVHEDAQEKHPEHPAEHPAEHPREHPGEHPGEHLREPAPAQPEPLEASEASDVEADTAALPAARRPSLAPSETTEASERRGSATWDALADAVGGHAVAGRAVAGRAVVTQPMAPAPKARVGPTAAAMAMAGLESEEPSEAESEIDDDDVVAMLG